MQFQREGCFGHAEKMTLSEWEKINIDLKAFGGYFKRNLQKFGMKQFRRTLEIQACAQSCWGLCNQENHYNKTDTSKHKREF